MLKKIIIRNFQAHKKLEVDLDQHITTFVGPTEAGKSTILRALRWACLNQPSGEDFLRWGKNNTSVELVFNDHSIKRSKGKKGNLYSIDGRERRSFGMGNVPQDIEAFLNMGEVNFQEQFDLPFWLAEAPSQLSRKLNKIVNLGDIDDTLDRAAKKLRLAKSRMEANQEQLQEAKQKKKSLSHIPKLVKSFNRLLAKEEELTKTAQELEELDSIITKVKAAQTTKEQGRKATHRANLIVQKLGEILDLQKQEHELTLLTELIEETRSHTHTIIPDLSKMERVLDAYKKICVEEDKLHTTIEAIKLKETEICHKKQLLGEIETEMMTKLEGRCPVCNQKVENLQALCLPS